ncbi:MAG: hypothetical protein ABIP20_09510 [Chthoniobacteraceae bacterium]
MNSYTRFLVLFGIGVVGLASLHWVFQFGSLTLRHTSTARTMSSVIAPMPAELSVRTTFFNEFVFIVTEESFVWSMLRV